MGKLNSPKRNLNVRRRETGRKATATGGRLSLKLRLIVDGVRAIGPGKADLLEGIQCEGSIMDAARKMKMSYRRAWGLVREMNKCFSAPLVEARVGGASGGKARLSPLGIEVLRYYRSAEVSATKAAEPGISALRQKLRG